MQPRPIDAVQRFCEVVDYTGLLRAEEETAVVTPLHCTHCILVQLRQESKIYKSATV